jgi:hypothetical protein
VAGDPLLGSGGAGAWAAWLRHLLSAARARLAGAVALVLIALVACLGALYVFGAVADDVTEGQTAALDANVRAALLVYASPPVDLLARAISACGAELLAALLIALLAVFTVRRQWGTAVSLLAVTLGA